MIFNSPEHIELKKRFTKEMNRMMQFEGQIYYRMVCKTMRARIRSGHLPEDFLLILDKKIKEPKKETAHAKMIREELEAFNNLPEDKKKEIEARVETFRKNIRLFK